MKTDLTYRITEVQTSQDEDRRRRQRRYLIAMSTRSACFVSGVIFALAGFDTVWPLLMAGAIVLPYFAVVTANAWGRREDMYEVESPLWQLEAGQRDQALSSK